MWTCPWVSSVSDAGVTSTTSHLFVSFIRFWYSDIYHSGIRKFRSFFSCIRLITDCVRYKLFNRIILIYRFHMNNFTIVLQTQILRSEHKVKTHVHFLSVWHSSAKRNPECKGRSFKPFPCWTWTRFLFHLSQPRLYSVDRSYNNFNSPYGCDRTNGTRESTVFNSFENENNHDVKDRKYGHSDGAIKGTYSSRSLSHEMIFKSSLSCMSRLWSSTEIFLRCLAPNGSIF